MTASIWILPVFPTMSFYFLFQDTIQGPLLHLLIMPPSLLSLSLSFSTLTPLKSIGQLFCRMSCNVGLSNVNAWWHRGYELLERMPQKLHALHVTMSICLIPSNINPWTWLRWYLTGVFTVKLLFFHLSLISVYFKGSYSVMQRFCFC